MGPTRRLTKGELCACVCVRDLQNAYDMAELQKSLQPSPAQSLQYCRSRALHHAAHPSIPPPHHHYHQHHLLQQGKVMLGHQLLEYF